MYELQAVTMSSSVKFMAAVNNVRHNYLTNGHFPGLPVVPLQENHSS